MVNPQKKTRVATWCLSQVRNTDGSRNIPSAAPSYTIRRSYGVVGAVHAGAAPLSLHFSSVRTSFQTCPLLALQMLFIRHADVKCEGQGRGRPSCDAHVVGKIMSSRGLGCSALICCHCSCEVQPIAVLLQLRPFLCTPDCEKHDRLNTGSPFIYEAEQPGKITSSLDYHHSVLMRPAQIIWTIPILSNDKLKV